MSENIIPFEIAVKICDEVRENNKKKLLSVGKGMCWGCIKFSKDDVKKRCFFNSEKNDNRGCFQINNLFDSGNYHIPKDSDQ